MQYLLTIAYDGTAYAGWQRQDNAIAVQQRVEEALSTLLQRSITINAASRTDAGVHALGQCATFTANDLRVPLSKLPQVLAGFLPPDISVTDAVVVPDEFHPQYHATQKTYVYKIHQATVANPLLRRYSAFEPRALDTKVMQAAAPLFIGRHDFAAFCATGGNTTTTVREIYDCQLTVHKNLFSLSVTGNGFLYNMVRIIAGTVLYVGLGKIAPDKILSIIVEKDRRLAGKTMPPQGLTLVEVRYDGLHTL